MIIKTDKKLVKISSIETILGVELTSEGIGIHTSHHGDITFELDEQDRDLAFHRLVNAVASKSVDDIDLTEIEL